MLTIPYYEDGKWAWLLLSGNIGTVSELGALMDQAGSGTPGWEGEYGCGNQVLGF